MQSDSRCNLSRAVVESHPTIVNAPNGGNDMFDLKRVAQDSVAHAAASAERHLGILDVESGRRKKIDRTGMVEMHVRQHDVANKRGIDAYPVEHVSNRSQYHASGSPRRGGSVHAGIDDDCAL
jgi:hypothetical protein